MKATPDTITMAEAVRDVGQAAVEETVKKVKTGDKAISKAVQEPAKSDRSKKSDEKTIGGYELADILKAPVEPPTPAVNETKEDVANPLVKILVFIGVIVVAIGLILAFFVLAAGVILIFLGALPIIFAVFAPIRARRKSSQT